MADVTTLRTLCAQGALQDTVLYDIAKSLMQLILEDKIRMALSPDTVAVDGDGLVVLSQPAPSNRGEVVKAQDLSFSSPEVIFQNKAADKTDHLFSLGLIMAWMKSGKNLYAQSSGGVFAYAPAQQGSFSQGLVSSLRGRDAAADASALVSDAALSAIIRSLTDSIPQRRHDGARALLEHLVKNMPGEAKVNFVHRGRIIASRTETLRMDIDDMLQGQPIYASDGLKYVPAAMVHIPYRPGSHTYTIDVWPMKQAQTHRQVYVKFAGPGEPTLMFTMDETGKQAQFQRSLTRRQAVTVLAMDMGPDGQSVPAATQRLTLPASPEGKTGLLTFTCLERGRVGVTLVDAQGVHLLAPETALTVGLPE